jgi:UDP-glucuronate 4-epimerase
VGLALDVKTSSYLVTGAAGFIGYHLSESLLAKGHTVVGLDNLSNYYDVQLKRDRLARLRRHAQFMFIRMNMTDRDGVAQLFRNARFDSVFHLAAQAGVRYSLENPHAYIDSNIVAFVNVLEGCRQNPPDHLVFGSSSSVYGANTKVPFDVKDPVDRPVSVYAATKRCNELFSYTYSHLYGLRITGLRFFTVYGPWGRPDMAIYRFTRAMLAGEPIDVFNHGQMRRDFTYVDDVVAGILLADNASAMENTLQSPSAYHLYNIGNNRPVALADLILILEECLGVKAELRYHDMQPGDVVETYADIEASTRELDFKPLTSIRQGIERFVAWYRDYHSDRVPGRLPVCAPNGHT